jgi:DNA modification methylase
MMKIITWTSKRVKLSDLVEYVHNPVQISERDAKELSKSLAKFGNVIPYVAAAPQNGSKRIPLLDGHQRKAVSIQLNKQPPDTMVDVQIPSRKLTLKEKQELIVRLRKNTGTFDFDILANNFDVPDLLEWGFDEKELLGAGFDVGGEDADAEPQIDRAEAINKIWKVKVGDCFSIGQHKLLCGDATSEKDIQNLMGKDRATLLFTDPPYGVAIGAKNRMLNSFQKAGKSLTDIESDQDSEEDLGAMLLSAFTLIKKYLANDCSVFVCSPQGGSLGLMMMMMMNAGLEIRHVLNWVKNSPTFSLGRLDYEYQHEPILFTWVKTHKRYKRGFTTSTWNVNKPMHSADHPTIKPVELPTNAILNHTDEGDIVVDNFGGSGTTMVASENHNRKCRMMELSPANCAVILQRMTDAFPDIKIERIK